MKATRSSSITSGGRRRSSSTSAAIANAGESASNNNPVDGEAVVETPQEPTSQRRPSTRERKPVQLLTPGTPLQVYGSTSTAETPKSTTRSRRRVRGPPTSNASSTGKKAASPPSDILAGTPHLPLTHLVASGAAPDTAAGKGRLASSAAKRQTEKQSTTPASLSSLSKHVQMMPLDVPDLQAQFKGKDVTVRLVINGHPFQPTSRYRRTGPSVLPPATASTDATGTAATTKGGRRIHKAAPTFVGQDGNLFYCVVCQEVGDVVCCDGCPHVYHQKCLRKGSPSRVSLENDDDPWYCPDCMENKKPSAKQQPPQPQSRLDSRPSASRSGGGRGETKSPRRTIKHRCQECRQKRPELALEPCEECGLHVHYPSCRPTGESSPPNMEDDDDDERNTPSHKIMCSSCRADAALSKEESELQEKKKRRKVEEARIASSNAMAGQSHEETPVRDEGTVGKARLRTRSMDEAEHYAGTPTTADGFAAMDEESDAAYAVESSGMKRRRAASDAVASPLAIGEVGTPKSDKKKKKKKKKKRKLEESEEPLSTTETGSMMMAEDGSHPLIPSDDVSPFAELPPLQGPPTQATPAFHFYLSEQRPKVEKVLSRKHRYFNRLPKGAERNALIAKETAKQWIKLSPVDQKKYINMSMLDYESRIIKWKEEKNVRDMIAGEGNPGIESAKEFPGSSEDMGPDDAILTYEMYERLYMGTSVGSKPYKPEPTQSHNRVLLDLLRDARFHPLPMLLADRSPAELKGAAPSSKIVIKHFEVHGPIATSIGDECMGCTRGWPHFCPVMQRRIPAATQRSKLQPAGSALISSRVGLGLRPRLERLETEETIGGSAAEHDCVDDLLVWKEAKPNKDVKSVRFVPSATLSNPSNRADDVVQFIEQVVAMKIPEPPEPPKPVAPPTTKVDATPRKSLLARGLPTRHKRTPDVSNLEAEENHGDGGINKCGRCRTIIMNESGCVQCRRAQLVIKMSRRHTPAHIEQEESDKTVEKEETMKVQTAMLCRVITKEAVIGETQLDSDKRVSKALMKVRWTPSAILPPITTLAPSPSRRSKTKPEEKDGSLAADKEENLGTQSNIVQLPNHKDKKSQFGLVDEMEIPSQTTTDPGSELRPRNSRRPQKEPETFDNQGVDRQATAKQFKKEAEKVSKRALSISCSGILVALLKRDPFLLFAQPVSAEGYLAIVKSPMDFGKIREKVLNGSYQKLSIFVADVRLLCDNALIFNPPGSIYWKTAKELWDILLVMQKRVSKWINAIKNAHASFWRRSPIMRKTGHQSGTEVTQGDTDAVGSQDPLKELRLVWPEAVSMYENSDWLKGLLTADFTRTKENETAFYGSLAIRRAAKAAEECLAPYTDTGGAFSAVIKRSHIEDEELRNVVDSKVANVLDSVQLSEISSGREEAVVRLLRRVQSRRLERRIGSENGCARCDARGCGSLGADHEVKAVMNADAVRWGQRNKKHGEGESDTRVAQSRLDLTTGLASAKTRKHIAERRELSGEAAFEPVESSVSLRGSRVHGLGLFSEQFFKKGEVVCEYIGECVSLPVTERREKIYAAMRIQDYQFRLDDSQIIDATLNGGLGRYVNHNCNPNCNTKIIPGKEPNQHLRRVLIVALRNIEPREELSYDYQFPLESDIMARIPCNCQSDVCRGFMNWDLPEKGANTGAIRTQKRGANMRDRIRRLARPLKK